MTPVCFAPWREEPKLVFIFPRHQGLKKDPKKVVTTYLMCHDCMCICSVLKFDFLINLIFVFACKWWISWTNVCGQNCRVGSPLYFFPGRALRRPRSGGGPPLLHAVPVRTRPPRLRPPPSALAAAHRHLLLLTGILLNSPCEYFLNSPPHSLFLFHFGLSQCEQFFALRQVFFHERGGVIVFWEKKEWWLWIQLYFSDSAQGIPEH